MAKCHPFNFDGGEELSHMGATWFVSFAYYTYVDRTHKVWENVKTYVSRRSIFPFQSLSFGNSSYFSHSATESGYLDASKRS